MNVETFPMRQMGLSQFHASGAQSDDNTLFTAADEAAGRNCVQVKLLAN